MVLKMARASQDIRIGRKIFRRRLDETVHFDYVAVLPVVNRLLYAYP